jgi:hypothetical protein
MCKPRFSPDSKRVITEIDDPTYPLDPLELVGTAQLWDPATGGPIGAPMPGVPVFSIDGRRIFSFRGNRGFVSDVGVWDPSTGKRLDGQLERPSYADDVGSLVRTFASFSPNGRLVLVAGENRATRDHYWCGGPVSGIAWLIDAISGKALGRPMRHECEVPSAVFSPDATRIVTVSGACRVMCEANGETILRSSVPVSRLPSRKS